MGKTIGIKILVVEDNMGDKFLLQEYLNSSGLLISLLEFTLSMEDALRKISEANFDVILLDLTLPDCNGLESFKRIKAANSSTAIIILSGMADTDFALEAIASGAQDYIIKDDMDERILFKTISYSIERKRNLDELRAFNERYNLVLKASNDLVWDWNVKKNEVYRNPEQFKRILKLPEEMASMPGDQWFGRIKKEDLEKLQPTLNRIFTDPSLNIFESEYQFLNGEGNYVYLYDRGYIVRDQDGNAIRVIGATQDITQRKIAENELMKLSMIASETVNAVILTDPAGNVEWVNDAFTRITEYSLEEVLGKKPGTILQGPDTNKETVYLISDHLKRQLPIECELLNYTKSGRQYWIKIQMQPMFDETGKLQHFFALETDITEQKMAEEIIRKSEEQYRYLFDNNPASIFIWYIDDYKFADINDTAIQKYGYSKDELMQQSFLHIQPLSAASIFRQSARKAKLKESFHETFVVEQYNKSGELIFMQVSLHKIRFNNRQAILSLAVDVTDKITLEKKLEEEKNRKEKEITQAVITAQEQEREEIGRELHDNINQILACSKLYLGMVKRENDFTYLEETEKLISNAIEEIRGLSHSLIPPSFQEDEFLDALNNIIEITSAGTNLSIRKEIKGLRVDRLPNKLRLTIYRILQEQFNNILKYASATEVVVRLIQEENGLQLSIIDNGKGFVLNNKTGGVGLMNIRTRASLFNGEVLIDTAPGKGVNLTVMFQGVK